MKEDNVVLVDNKDKQIGLMPKLEAHEKGLLHRAFSVFVFNDKGELMLQQRATHKYHSPGLWTNTCCSHPRSDEAVIDAGMRRLQEEMGFVSPLQKITSFIYKTSFDNGLIEHEYDHVLLGKYNHEPKINTEEVADWKWMTLEEVKIDLEYHPQNYTVWFRIIFLKFYPLIQSFLKL